MNAVIIPGSYSGEERNSLEFQTVIELSFSHEYGNEINEIKTVQAKH